MHFHIPKVHFRCIISLSLSLKPIFISFRHFWIKDQHAYISFTRKRWTEQVVVGRVGPCYSELSYYCTTRVIIQENVLTRPNNLGTISIQLSATFTGQAGYRIYPTSEESQEQLKIVPIYNQ